MENQVEEIIQEIKNSEGQHLSNITAKLRLLDDVDIDKVVQLLSEDTKIKLSVAKVLIELGMRGLDRISKGLENLNESGQIEGILCLGCWNEQKSINALTKLYQNSTSFIVKYKILETLTDMVVFYGRLPENDYVVRFFINYLDDEHHQDEIIELLTCIGPIAGDIASPIINDKNTKPIIRANLVAILCRVSDPIPYTRLIQLLDDDTVEVRAVSIYHLGISNRVEAIPFLKAIIQNESQVRLIKSAIIALGKIQNPVADEFLRQISLKDDYRIYREEIAKALGKQKNEQSVPILEIMLVESDYYTTIAIISALSWIQSDSAMSLLSTIFQRSDYTMKEYILSHLPIRPSVYTKSSALPDNKPKESVLILVEGLNDENSDIVEFASSHLIFLGAIVLIPLLDILTKDNISDDLKEKIIQVVIKIYNQYPEKILAYIEEHAPYYIPTLNDILKI